MVDFVHLHVHTEYSLLDGLSKIKKLVAAVKDMGMSSLAITDHGNMYGAIEFYKACKSQDIKPIIGAELYLVEKDRTDKTASNRKNYHLILLAKNQTGYKNLISLVSKGHLEGFYYRPRIDWQLLKKYHQGLICTSACVEGQIAQLVLDNKMAKAIVTAKKYQKLFKDDFYLEIQHHPGLAKQEQANQGLIDISHQLGIPLVATNDAHYIQKEDAFAQDVLMMINTQTTTSSKDRLSMLDVPDFYIKTPQEMKKLFKDTPEALKNTQKIADKCNLDIEIGKWYFPKFNIPEGETTETYLKKLTFQSATDHYGQLSKEITDRLNFELDIICSKGYGPYFLIMRDFIKWAEKIETVTNTRGSAAGSLTSFVLGITSVDPLIYRLPFERFLTRERPTPPDIDLDIADNKRQEMLYHISQQYGLNAVAQVCTFGRMMARGAVRDTARVLGYEYAIGDRISKLIPMGSQGFPMSINKALDTTPELKEIYDSDPDAKKILDSAKQIEGNARHVSVHACALVISPTTLNDFCPVQKESGGDKIITQYEMHAVEDVGLIKYDILGIRNLSIMGAAISNVKKTKNKKINIRQIPLDDKKTFKMLSQGYTMGTFQLSGEGMTKWLKELQPSRVEDIMAMVALYRPGPMAMIPEYIARKRDPSKTEYFDPRMEKYLDKSYGLLVYQDDCLYTAVELAGYTWTEVDKFRKAIGKKIPEEMQEQKEKFIQGCVNNGFTRAKAEQIFSYIEPFTSYGFNKAHAASYGMLAYYTAYMKANYPVEFMCALLTAESEDVEKIGDGVEECRKMGIIVSPPDINKSVSGFEIEANPDSTEGMAIRFGLNAIKNVGDAAIETIISERTTNGPFTNFSDFCLRVDTRKVNKRVLESLIKVGALDQFGNRNSLLAAIDDTRQKTEKLNQKKRSGQFGLFDQNPKDGKTEINLVDTLPKLPDMDEKEKLAIEKELLGVYVTSNPIKKLLQELNNLNLPKIESINQKSEGTYVKTVGVISKIKQIRTKKTNARMAFLTLEDETGRIETVVFPKTFEESETLLTENKAIYIEGRLSLKDSELSLLANLIQDQAPKDQQQYDFVIEIPPKTSPSKLMNLNNLLKQNPNGHRGLIILENGKKVPISFGVHYNSGLQKQIDQILS